MQNQPSPGCLRVAMERNISIPSADSEREMAIRCSDWTRIERGLESALDLTTDFSTWYGILFGFGGSALVALIPLTITKDLPTWVLPVSYSLAIGAIIGGGIVVFFSRILKRARRKMISDLLDDVRDIGSRFMLEETQEGQITAAENYELPDRTAP